MYIYTTTEFGPRKNMTMAAYTISLCICKLPQKYNTF